MRFRNTLVSSKKSKNNDQLNKSVAVHHKLQGFQDLSDSLNLQFDRTSISAPKQTKQLKLKQKQDIRNNRQGNSQKRQRIPLIFSLEDNLRLDYFKWSLKNDFLGLFEAEKIRKASEPSEQSSKLTEDWIIKLKANKAKKLLYEEQAYNLRKQKETINRIKARLKILDQIKQEKRRILHQYFNR